MDQRVLSLNEEQTANLLVMIKKSHVHYIDLNTVLDWEKGINRRLNSKRDDHSWVYQTKYWDALTPEQRTDLLWKENAHTVSMFIWLESTLPPLFMSLLHANRGAISGEIFEYMMIFSREEITHILMFRRFLELARLDAFEPPEVMSFLPQLASMHPIAAILLTYLTEGIAEESAIRQDRPDGEPLTRKMYKEHHFEEARHLAFGRWIIESFLETCPEEAKFKLGYLARRFMSSIVPLFTYNPEISRYIDYSLVDPKNVEEIDRVRKSPNNERINQERFGPMLAWMKRLGLAQEDYSWFDEVQPMPPGFGQ